MFSIITQSVVDLIALGGGDKDTMTPPAQCLRITITWWGGGQNNGMSVKMTESQRGGRENAVAMTPIVGLAEAVRWNPQKFRPTATIRQRPVWTLPAHEQQHGKGKETHNQMIYNDL